MGSLQHLDYSKISENGVEKHRNELPYFYCYVDASLNEKVIPKLRKFLLFSDRYNNFAFNLFRHCNFMDYGCPHVFS